MSEPRITEDLSDEAIVNTVAELALTETDTALSDLTSLLKEEYVWFGENNLPLPLLASLALLQKGNRGIQVLKDKVLKPLTPRPSGTQFIAPRRRHNLKFASVEWGLFPEQNSRIHSFIIARR